MSVLENLASKQNRRDENPNKELAGELAGKKDTTAIKEIVENLWNRDRNIQSDCASVLEEIGHLDPGLIEDHVPDFLKLLSGKSNRLVWGAMIILSMVADRKPGEIFDNLDLVIKAIKNGSVITRDNGIKTLAIVASANEEYNKAIFPFLIEHLKACRPKDVPQHAESIFVAVNPGNTVSPGNELEYTDVLHGKQKEATKTQSARIRKLLKRLEHG